jgi:hypothetical protein
MSGSMDQGQAVESFDEGALFSQLSATNQQVEQQEAQRVIQDSLRKIRDKNFERVAGLKDFLCKNIATEAVRLEDPCDCLEVNDLGYPKNGERLLVKGYPSVLDAQLQIDYSNGLELRFTVTLKDRYHIHYSGGGSHQLSYQYSAVDIQNPLNTKIEALYDRTVSAVEEKISLLVKLRDSYRILQDLAKEAEQFGGLKVRGIDSGTVTLSSGRLSSREEAVSFCEALTNHMGRATAIWGKNVGRDD